MTPAELEPCPVPGCGSRTDFYDESEFVTCLNIDCTYVAPTAEAHNTLCRRAEVGRLVEEIVATGQWVSCEDNSPTFYARTLGAFQKAPTLLEALRSLAAEVTK